MFALYVRDKLLAILLLAAFCSALRSSDYYVSEAFRNLNAEITDLNAANIPKPNDPRNPCPWPEYPHVGGRYCERRCGQNQTDIFRPGWCEQAETEAQIKGDDYACICPWRLARHANGACVTLVRCSPLTETQRCSENETLSDCASESYCGEVPTDPYVLSPTRSQSCRFSGPLRCVCRPNFYRSIDANHSCVWFEDCPLGPDNFFGQAIKNALAVLPKCPGDFEVPRCGSVCDDLTCANLTHAVLYVASNGSQIRNGSSCSRVCTDAGHKCRCQLGFVRHEGRCIWPDACPRSSFPECARNEQLNFSNGTDLFGCPERDCGQAARIHQRSKGGSQEPSLDFSSCTAIGGGQIVSSWPTCWCPRSTHFRNSTGACVSQEECRVDPAYATMKANEPSDY